MPQEEMNPTQAPEMATEAAESAPEIGAEATVGASSEAEALKAALSAKQQAYEDLESQMRRLAADFDNFRRRQAQERENLVKFAGERILERFLDVNDNFERAIEAARTATDPQKVVEGVEMIYRQIQSFLEKEGVAPMQAKGAPFDPNMHEAVVQQPVDDVPDQTVLEVFRQGYLLNGRVIRHAMVQVAHNPAMPQVPSNQSQPQSESTAEPEQNDPSRSS